jgi:WD40 repeat protein
LAKKSKINVELSKTIEMKYAVKSILVLEDDVNLAVGDASPVISIWNISNKVKLKNLIGHESSVMKLVKISNQMLASGSADTTIKVWNCTSDRLSLNLTGHSQTVTDLVILDNRCLISSSTDSTIRFWELKFGLETARLKDASNPVAFLCLFQSKYLACSIKNHGIQIWNVVDRKKIQYRPKKDVLFKSYYACLTFLRNGLLVSGDSLIKIWNVSNGYLVNSLYGHSRDLVALIELRADHLASSSLDMTLKIWNYKNGTCLKTLKSHSDQILSLALFSNETYLLSGSLDKTVKIWNLMLVFDNSTKNLAEYG